MEKAKEFDERSDYALDTDSGDPEDRGLRPNDAEALLSLKEGKIKVRCFSVSNVLPWFEFGGNNHFPMIMVLPGQNQCYLS